MFEDGLTLANSNNQSVGNPEAGHTAVTATFTTAQILSLVNIGADEAGDGDAGRLRRQAIEGTATGLQSKGSPVSYHVVRGPSSTAWRRQPGCVHADRRRRRAPSRSR